MAAGQLRLHRRMAADRPPCRVRMVPHAEDLVERHHQVPAPLVHVGRHRRLAHLHPLPTGGYLCRLVQGPGTRLRREELPGQGSRRPLASALRFRRWRRRPHAQHDGAPAPLREPRRRLQGERRRAERLLRQGASAACRERRPGNARLEGRAVPRTASRHFDLATGHETRLSPRGIAAAHGRIPGRGRHVGRPELRLSARRAGPYLEDPDAQPVP